MSEQQLNIYKEILDAEANSKTKLEAIKSSVSHKYYALKKWALRGGDDPEQIAVEKELWKKFGRLAMGVDKISLELINKLGVKYDCLFILGKKGIGKTWMLKKLFEAADDADEHVIYGRNRLIEIQQNLIDSFNGDSSWIFKCKGTNMPIRLFSRKYFDELGKPLRRGYLIPLKGSDAGFGQDYLKVKHIVFDEVVAHRAGVITQEAMDRFTKFLNSVIRSKKGVKAYFFGNLLKNTDDSANSVFMKNFGLTWEDNLKYLKVSNPEDNAKPLTLLYINTRHFFKGMDDEGGISHLTTNYEYKGALANNTISPTCPKVLTDVTYGLYDTWFNIIVTHKNVFTTVECRKYTITSTIYRGAIPIDIEETHYACGIVPFNPTQHNKTTFTNLGTVAGAFEGIIKYRSDEDLAPLWDKIKKMSLKGSFMYGNEEAYKTLDEIIKRNYKDEGLFTSL